jgi:hypothetical protein
VPTVVDDIPGDSFGTLDGAVCALWLFVSAVVVDISGDSSETLDNAATCAPGLVKDASYCEADGDVKVTPLSAIEY